MSRGPKVAGRGLWRVVAFLGALAVLVAGWATWSEDRDYEALARFGVPVRARVTHVPAAGRRGGNGLRYAFELGGRTYDFDDRGSTRLSLLVSTTPDAFEGPNAPIAEGRSIHLLVDPRRPEHHVADRRFFTNPRAIWPVRLVPIGMLAVFVAVCAYFGFRPVREKRAAHS